MEAVKRKGFKGVRNSRESGLTRVLVPLVLSQHAKVQQQFRATISFTGRLVTRGQISHAEGCSVVFQLRIELYDATGASCRIKSLENSVQLGA